MERPSFVFFEEQQTMKNNSLLGFQSWQLSLVTNKPRYSDNFENQQQQHNAVS